MEIKMYNLKSTSISVIDLLYKTSYLLKKPWTVIGKCYKFSYSS